VAKFLITFGIFFALFIDNTALLLHAQVSASNKEYLRGLSQDELMKYLGKPDQIAKQGASADSTSDKKRSEWRYGNSLVFIVDGKVTAWSDSGDLEARKLVSSLQPKNGRGRLKDGGLEGWKNAWQKEEEVTSDQVVSELLSQASKR
jgi:hypothetical protein